jgi:hypothetical protein
MKRRRFLLLSASGLFVAAAGTGAARLWQPDQGSQQTQSTLEHLQSLARTMSGVAVLGRAWNQQHQGNNPESELLNALGLSAGELLSAEQFIERLAERIETELDQAQLFIHNGWWLAETEARLAGLHVKLLGEHASEAETPSFDSAAETEVVQLERFQPRSIRQGETISRPGLPEGVIWFATAKPPPAHLVIMLSGRRLTVRVTDKGFSIRVPETVRNYLSANPGDHEIWVYDPVIDRRQFLGHFTVNPGEPDALGSCAIERWGPQSTTAGQQFNTQADGNPAIWIRVGCFPPDTVVVFNDIELPTTLHPDRGLITANFPHPTLYNSAGTFPVALVDQRTGQSQKIGEFRVLPGGEH